MKFYYNDILRLDWGFENPNFTAALVVVVLAFAGMRLWPRAFVVFYIVMAVFGVFLLQTMSRGGLVAVGVGCLAALLIPKAKWNRLHWGLLLLLVVGLFVFSNSSGFSSRYSQGIGAVEDKSLTNRWLIYQAVPRMISDAPAGWGVGQAGDVYQQWYQPTGRHEIYTTLVGSHWTWLVEWSLLPSLFYCVFWVFVFVVSFPNKESESRWYGMAFSVWVTFFVAAMFSSVAHEKWLWVLPSVLIVAVIIDRFFIKKNYPYRRFLQSGAIGCAIYLCIIMYGYFSRPSNIMVHHGDAATRCAVKNPSHKIAVIGMDQKIIGKKHGHQIRDFVVSSQKHSVTIGNVIPASLKGIDTIVLVGSGCTLLGKIPDDKKVVLLNPTERVPESEHGRVLHILWGEFHASPHYYFWKNLAVNNENIVMKTIAGEGSFLTDWVGLASH